MIYSGLFLNDSSNDFSLLFNLIKLTLLFSTVDWDE
ncbi:hypothetical protein YPPY54_1839, partial [Yersinia pestis PY-54]